MATLPTAVKLNAGRYLEVAVNGNGNYSALLPVSRITTSVTRTWADVNGNFEPDKKEIGEHWDSNGESIFEYNPKRKQVIERPIPPEKCEK